MPAKKKKRLSLAEEIVIIETQAPKREEWDWQTQSLLKKRGTKREKMNTFREKVLDLIE